MAPARRLPPLNAVRAFDAAARRQSFTAASAELNVTPGAISRHVTALEEVLGVKLFERLHRKVELTTSGEFFLREVGPALERIAAAAEAVSAGANDRVLRVKLPPTCAIRWFVPRLASFHARNPSFSVQVTTSHEPVDFERDQIDAAIYWGDAIRPGLAGIRLFGERLVPVCSPKFLREARREADLIPAGDLTQHALLHSFRRPDDWGRWFAAAGHPGTRLERLLIFENSSLVYQGAIDGLGVAIAQLAFIAEDLRLGRLVVANDFFVETESAYFLTYPRERGQFPRIRALSAWLTDEAATQVSERYDMERPSTLGGRRTEPN
jgi:LysR family transcriptional regulator, glycine cleavage system transcriptional activator